MLRLSRKMLAKCEGILLCYVLVEDAGEMQRASPVLCLCRKMLARCEVLLLSDVLVGRCWRDVRVFSWSNVDKK